MNILCQMDEDDEYSLLYEFSDRITKADKYNVSALMKNVLERGNTLNLEQPKDVMNIATGAILEKDEEDFLMNSISLGKAARNEFYESRLTEKNIKLRKASRKRVRKKNMIWLKKQLIFASYWLCSFARFRS